ACSAYVLLPSPQFRLRRQPTIRRELVYDVGQNLGQMRRNFLFRQAGFLRQDFDDLRTQRRTELVRRNWLILSRPNPRIHYVAKALLLELGKEAAQSP